MAMPKEINYSANSEIVFFDDFNSGQLDRSKWNVRVTGKTVNQEQQAYIDSAETIYIATGKDAPGSDGHALALHPRYRAGYTTPEGKPFDFISGRMDTRETFEFTYGIASARLKLSAGTGLWPAFWALGKDQWPDTGEIDIMENIGEPEWTSAAVHGPNYFGESGLVNNHYFPLNKDATGWHIYSVDWSPNRLEFKVDDILMYRVTRAMVEFHGKWVFDNPKYLILNVALGGTYPFKVNGIHYPYYGIAEETVQKIKDNQAKVLVDWVQVIKAPG
jgi:beta-glucanase (GH16 family)